MPSQGCCQQPPWLLLSRDSFQKSHTKLALGLVTLYVILLYVVRRIQFGPVFTLQTSTYLSSIQLHDPNAEKLAVPTIIMAGMLKLIHALPQLLRKNASGHGIQTVGAVNFADRSRRLSRTEAPPVLQMLTRGGNHSSILSRFGRSADADPVRSVK